jgi:hypothetical protein
MTPPNGLFSIRTALIVLAALMIAVLAGTLSYMSGQSLPAAVLYAGGAFFGTLLLGHKLIDPPAAPPEA